MMELGEQTVRLTLSTLLKAAELALRHNKGITHGEQRIEKLNMQGKQLEHISLMGDDIKSFRKELNRYGVDFAVIKDKQTGQCSVFFKGQDADRVNVALKKVLNTAVGRSNNGKKSAKDIMQDAVKKAAARADMQQQKPEKSRSADRGER